MSTGRAKAPPRLAATVLIAVATLSSAAPGAELRVGLAAAPRQVDPHLAARGADAALARHLYDRLLEVDAGGRVVPGLARSWRASTPTLWRFELRRRARFHDGTPVAAADVAASLERAVEHAAALGAGLRGMRARALDAHTVEVRTGSADATVPAALARVAVVAAGEGGVRLDARGAPLGSGPYRLAEFRPGEALVLERHEGYWGAKPEWTRVVLSPIAAEHERLAALRAGRLDLVEAVSGEPGEGFAAHRGGGDRLIYLQLDQGRERSPYLTGADGETVANALRDARVRRALSLALDRARLATTAGVPAGQLIPPGGVGHDASLHPPAASPARAREMLAAAGVAPGVRLTLHCPRGRYPRDAEVCAAIAAMFSAVGVETAAVTMPASEFFRRASRGGAGGEPEFSAMLSGWLAGAEGAASVLRAVIHSRRPGSLLGRSNRGRYASPPLDDLIEQALAAFEPRRRAGLLALATERAIEDLAVIPLYFERATWFTRAGIGYRPRADTLTLATDAYSE